MASAKKIIDFVAEQTGVGSDLLSTNAGSRAGARAREVYKARAVAMTLTRDICGYSNNRIGKHFDRDESTVWHAVHRCQSYPGMRQLYSELLPDALEL